MWEAPLLGCWISVSLDGAALETVRVTERRPGARLWHFLRVSRVMRWCARDVALRGTRLRYAHGV